MELAGREKVEAAKKAHTPASSALDLWVSRIDSAVWNSVADIRLMYPTASWIAPNRAIFNIKGNSYRLITVLEIQGKTVEVRWFGTHAEYDKVDAATI